MNWRYRDTVLVLCTCALFVAMFGRLALSPVVPDIAADFDVSHSMVGLALSGMWLGYALMQFPSSVFADRFGDRFVILVAVGGTGAATLVIVASSRFVTFLLGTTILGALAGLHYSVATSLLTRLYDQIGTAIGVHDSGSQIAGLVTPIIVVWIAVRFGWRPAVFTTVIISCVISILFVWQVRPTEPREPDRPIGEQFELERMVELLSRPEILFTGVLSILFDFIWQALASFLPTLFIEHHGYSQSLAGALFAIYFAAQAILQIGVGTLGDHYSRDFALSACTISGIVALTMLYIGQSVGVLVLGLAFLGFSMGATAAVLPRLMDILSEDNQSYGFGLFRTSTMVIAAPGSAVFGLLIDSSGWGISVGFLICLLLLVGCLLTANRIFENRY